MKSFLKSIPIVICLAIAQPACGLLGPKDPTAIAQEVAPVVFDDLVLTFDLLDAALARYIGSSDSIMGIEEILQLKADVEHLVAARDDLKLMKEMLDGTKPFKLANFRTATADCVKNLNLVVESLKSYGVYVPTTVTNTLDMASKVLG